MSTGSNRMEFPKRNWITAIAIFGVLAIGLVLLLTSNEGGGSDELDSAVQSLSITTSAVDLSEALRHSADLAGRGQLAKAQRLAGDVEADASGLAKRAAVGPTIPASLPETIDSIARSASQMEEVQNQLSETSQTADSSMGKLAALKSEKTSLNKTAKQALSTTKALDRATNSLAEALEDQRLALAEEDALSTEQEDTIKEAEAVLNSPSGSTSGSLEHAIDKVSDRLDESIDVGPFVSGPYDCGAVPDSSTTVILNEGSFSCTKAVDIALNSSGPNNATGPNGWDCSGFAQDLDGAAVQGTAGYACSGANGVRISVVVAAAESEPVGLDWFQSPSGNILCAISSDQVRCDIGEKSWTAPRPASCDLDWGNGLAVGSGPAEVVCAGDTVQAEGVPSLEYGQSSQVGQFKCESSESGMRCENTATGNGFLISQSTYEVF